MICLICRQAETVHGLTIVKFERHEFRLIVKAVPALVCPGCGESYVEEAIAEQLLGMAKQRLDAGMFDTQCEYSIL